MECLQNGNQEMEDVALHRELREIIKATNNSKKEILSPAATLIISNHWKASNISFEDFEKELLLAAIQYQGLKEANAAQRQEYSPKKFKNIEKALQRSQSEITKLNDFESALFKNYIRDINRGDLRDSEIRKNVGYDIQIDEITRQIHPLNPVKLIATLGWLRQCAEACVRYNKIKTMHRVANEHIEVLIHLLMQLWKKNTEERFARQFFLEKSSKTKGLKPVSKAARFCVDAVKVIDPMVTPQEIDTAMKAVIRKAKMAIAQ